MLAGTGGTFPQWVALNFTAVDGDSIDRGRLIAAVTTALQIDEPAAEATIAELGHEGLLETASATVALSDAGRQRYAAIRAAIDGISAPLYAGIPEDDLATTRRVLITIAELADTQLARA